MDELNLGLLIIRVIVGVTFAAHCACARSSEKEQSAAPAAAEEPARNVRKRAARRGVMIVSICRETATPALLPLCVTAPQRLRGRAFDPKYCPRHRRGAVRAAPEWA